jgi:hypothetical protein
MGAVTVPVMPARSVVLDVVVPMIVSVVMPMVAVDIGNDDDAPVVRVRVDPTVYVAVARNVAHLSDRRRPDALDRVVVLHPLRLRGDE